MSGANERLGLAQYLRDQFRRGRFRIDAQQRFGTRCPHQDPGFRTVSIGGRIEKELNSIQSLDLLHFEAADVARFRISTSHSVVLQLVA